jgi:ATP-dependent DNA helicase RecQ
MARPTLDDARKALRASFGYGDFRPGQTQAVESVLAGRDTLVILPTGGGKSVCYQVPALLLPGLTVVVSPLISLMKDQVDALEARGIAAAFINSTLTATQIADRIARAQRGELKLLYVAPERFDAGSTADRLRHIGVSLLAIDEAHCISEWGHDFRPSYLRIREVRERLGEPPTIALTATATPEVRTDIAKQLELRDPAVVITGFDRRNLHYHVESTPTERDKDAALIAALRARDGLAVVYASTRKAVERITGVLERAGVSAAGYHAGLDDAHRHEVQDAFMSEAVRAIVATNAFGMGIDKPNVRLVVHHAMPGTLEAYYQEAGRAGRDGLPSDCVLLHAFPDRFTHEFFIKGAYPDRPLVERVHALFARESDHTGLVTLSSRDAAGMLPGKVSEREVESALRILVRAGALRSEPESTSRVFVRLLATPARIKRELGAGREAERELLRALWRGVGTRLEQGALVDLAGLPPGFGGSQGTVPLLEWLQERQFVVWERTGGGTRLTDRRAPLTAFPVDWATLERRRRGELSKLDAVQRYAYTTGCRRAYVLRYFGDASADAACSGCDNCAGVHKGKERPAPGARPAAREPKRTAGRRGAAAPDAELVVGAADAALFARLRALRAELARAEQVPAYVVFPDRTLAEMAVRRPRSLHALADIRGVGPTKLERFGERFLDVIRTSSETEAA